METRTPTAAELSEYWCPLSIAIPKHDDQKIRLCVPGILDDTGPIRFGDLYWTEADE